MDRPKVRTIRGVKVQPRWNWTPEYEKWARQTMRQRMLGPQEAHFNNPSLTPPEERAARYWEWHQTRNPALVP